MEDHLAAYLADRATWQELVSRPDLDRSRGGKLLRKPQTIESLTRMLVSHEKHHLAILTAREEKKIRRTK